MKETVNRYSKLFDQMAQEIVRLRGALTFYGAPWDGRQQEDGGKLAQEALTAHLGKGGS